MADIYVGKGVTDLSTLGIGNSDTIIFGEGSQFINAGLTLTATNLSFEARPMFAGRLGGGSTGGVKCPGSMTVNWRAGGGEANFDPSNSSATNIESIGNHGMNVLGGGTVTLLDVNNSFTTVSDAVVVTELRQAGGDTKVGFNATDMTSLILSDNGRVTTSRGHSGTARVNGTLVVSREDTLTSGSQPNWAGAVIELGGGLFDFKGHTSTGGLSVNATGGRMSFTGVTVDTSAVVLMPAGVNNRSTFTSQYATVTTNKTQYGGDSDTEAGVGFAGSE